MKNIEWADRPWNPVTGCDRDCKWYLADGRAVGCYARTMNDRFHLQPNFNAPQFHPARLRQPYNWRRSQRVFVCSTSDLVRRLVDERRVNADMTEYLAGELADAKGAPFEGCSDNWTGWILVARGHVAQEDEKRAAKQKRGEP